MTKGGGMLSRRALLLSPLAARAQGSSLPDIREVEPDLHVPAMTPGDPRAGQRVRHQIDPWRGSEVYHTLYLPVDWRPSLRYPVIVEYAGNGNYKNEFGDVSTGRPEGSNLGYGISGGEGFVWLCLPYVNAAERRNQILWWGDVEATLDYCRRALDQVCQRYGGDPARVLLAGFSRGSIGCNYLGLHNGTIAPLWRGFVCYSHYDGVRTWPFPGGDDRVAALERLRRLRGRPQFICHERSVEPTRRYLETAGVEGRFALHDLPYRNHNDAWVLRPLALRATLREWVRHVLA